MKKILFFTIIIVSFIVINSLIHSIFTLWQKQDLLIAAQHDLEKTKKENQSLKKKLAEAKSPEFIEEEARNKLFLIQPGENPIVIPPTLLASKKVTKPTQKVSYFEEWIKLFTQ